MKIRNVKWIVAAGMVGLFGVTAIAQTPPTRTSTTPPAVATGNVESKTTAAPVPGANSFTEAQARSRLEDHGYSAISALTRDDQSIWRGKAMKDGRMVDVALDYQGNIVSQ